MAICFLVAACARAATFAPGNLAIYRVGVAGDGASPIGGGEPVFIDEYTTTGALVQSIAVPTVPVGSNRRLVAQGTGTQEGLLNLSPNGQFLTFGGYDAAPGTLNLDRQPSINRVVAIMDRHGQLNTTTSLSDWATSGSPRGTITPEGIDVYLTGGSTSSVRKVRTPASTSSLYTSVPNAPRHIDIFDGRLFVSVTLAEYSVAEINQSTGGYSYLTGVAPSGNTAPGPSVYQFWMTDLSAAVAGLDTIYVSDTRSRTWRRAA